MTDTKTPTAPAATTPEAPVKPAEPATKVYEIVSPIFINRETKKKGTIELTDEQTIAVLRSEAKKRAEAADVYEQAGRAESAAKERAELAVIERYLPAAMSDDELQAIVDEEVANAAAAGAAGQRGMGQVIKAVRERVGAGADGSRIAAMVKSALA